MREKPSQPITLKRLRVRPLAGESLCRLLPFSPASPAALFDGSAPGEAGACRLTGIPGRRSVTLPPHVSSESKFDNLDRIAG
jgi:hypothetical protein